MLTSTSLPYENLVGREVLSYPYKVISALLTAALVAELWELAGRVVLILTMQVLPSGSKCLMWVCTHLPHELVLSVFSRSQ